ncbi:type III-B CRISPR module RAMP protein Cmr6 [Sulfurovum sp.]|uniref:type III-B CRISPR module RAMP protein Cmr6 n=1 Tax=Sulfurovum sp. TaxID=1969726 RepID=UPI0025F5D45B|nr:type III-B CRISPR module RAMP protein Cmr6 [Sulfurovum sp.]
MSSANIGWLFYKDYYRELNYIDLVNKKEEHNSKIIEKKVQNIIDAKPFLDEAEIIGSTRFQATTAYPGLILGSGNAHEIPDVKGQAILGFHFDYTSGLPVIAGSSIKGVLRSAFKHPEYIQALLDDENVDVKALEEEIFDNADIFYDAHIIKADAYGRILGDDYITPHSDPLKDPIPLRFIKVLPDVTFAFHFELGEGILNRSEKEMLFRKILEELGLGAKTNVGYGKLGEFKALAKTKEELAREEEEKAQKEEERLGKLSPLDRVFDKYNNIIPDIINAMKANEIEQELFVELAKKIKSELVKKPKEWEKAKQKALKRKEYIESILKG